MVSITGLAFFLGATILSFHEPVQGAEGELTSVQLLLLHPYVVKVTYAPLTPDGEPIKCTGAVYNKLWIITSARCALPTIRMMAKTPTHEPGDINFGDEEPFKECKPTEVGRVRYAVEAHLPPEAKAALAKNESLDDFDISMVKINKPFLYTKHLKAIRVPSAPKDCADTNEAYIMGFGAAGVTDSKAPRKLRKIRVKTEKEEESKKADSTFSKDIRIVTKSVDKDNTCGSDLGAPLVHYVKINLKQAPVDIYHQFLCGVLRRTNCEDKGSGRPEDTEFFARVPNWVKWIQTTGGKQDKFD
ncbi:unnamed protein product [Allacma fusca]|uniref:Peptidase S1 domain-containing protein n=1 Tax=Allacma fusca TaxID=39272 RepID=A0A8J2JK14_9HEXA|nr:unnamed protein product [Allacma fusca]